MLATFSERLKVCRSVSGLSATYIVEQINLKEVRFSARQFSRWEQNLTDSSRILKSEALDIVVDVFNQNGLPELSAEWLLSGRGLPPFLVDMSGALEEEKAFYITRAMGKEYKLTTISSNYSEPFASTGDQIITREMQPEKLESKIAFVKTKARKLFLGILTNEEDYIKIDNVSKNETISKLDIEYCGKLTWIS